MKPIKNKATNIVFNHDSYDALNQYISVEKFSNIFVLVDSNTSKLCLPYFLSKLDSKDSARILKIEAIVYEILSLHIQTHKNTINDVKIPDSLLKSELRIVRKLSKQIVDNPSKNYDLKSMSMESGLSQLKLQDGFKHLYNRTVTDYIRHIRLQTARDLIRNSELNISQVVYTIGFTSRSYFSKIFKEKYGITPHEFKKQTVSVSV